MPQVKPDREVTVRGTGCPSHGQYHGQPWERIGQIAARQSGTALAVVIGQGLTSRECAIVVESLLKAKGTQEAGYIYSHSRDVIRQALQGDKLHDSRLSDHGNRLLKARELLRLQVNILGGVLQSEHTRQLPPEQKSMVLPPIGELVAPMSRLTDIIHKTLKSYER